MEFRALDIERRRARMLVAPAIRRAAVQSLALMKLEGAGIPQGGVPHQQRFE